MHIKKGMDYFNILENTHFKTRPESEEDEITTKKALYFIIHYIIIQDIFFLLLFSIMLYCNENQFKKNKKTKQSCSLRYIA